MSPKSYPLIRCCLGLLAISLPIFSTRAYAETVTWTQQAERLQNVNASFLDAVPMGEPLQVPRSVEFKAILSILPKPNSRVGGKLEKAPTAPLHSVPVLQYNQAVFNVENWKVGMQGWAGYLAEGTEKLIGLKVSLNQWLIGGAANLSTGNGPLQFYIPVGFQYAKASANGPITEEEAKDKFDTSTFLAYVAPGAKYPTYSVWASGMLALKRTKSKFVIPSDNTVFELEDSLDDSTLPFAMQVSGGWYHPLGVQVGLGQLWVPNRVSLPKMLVSYQYTF